MTALLDLVLESHGTLERWRKFNAIDVNLSMHGEHWKRKGWDGVFKNVQLKVQTKEQRTRYTHFTEEGVQSIYEPDRVRLETIDGKPIEERVHPRKAFEGHTLQTTWDRLHLAYFTGYALWNYLNTPFMFVTESAKAEEIDPVSDQGTVRRRLKVTFPEKVGTHCPEQIFHVDEKRAHRPVGLYHARGRWRFSRALHGRVQEHSRDYDANQTARVQEKPRRNSKY